MAFGGCVVSGPDPDQLVDTTLVTGSIAPAVRTEGAAGGRPTNAKPVAPSEQMSDERTVRNAVSAADIADSDGHYAWANPQTGTSGVISALQEVRDGPTICRSFKTSRQRFDGIALYRGEACTRGAGEWALVRFAESSG